MDSNRALRTEFRRALDDVLPPAPWLEAAVREDLRKRRSGRLADRNRSKAQQRRMALPRPVFHLTAAALIILLLVVAVSTFVALRSHAPQSSPAALDLPAYQALVNRDVNRLDSAGDGVSCTTLQSTCPAPGRPVLAAYQRWLDDLNRSEPPPRFAVIDAQLRRHLAAAIADLNAVFGAYRARDKNGLDLANYELQRQWDWADVIAAGIVHSRQGTVAAYTASVLAGKQNVAANTSLHSLGSTSQVDCAGIQDASCEADVANAKSTIEAFEAALVRISAPSALVAQDAVLQRDLAQADTGVLAMANAQLKVDQAGFDAGRRLLQQALLAVDADVTATLGG